MDERIQQYFQKELNPAERLAFLREVESNASLKKDFIAYQNLDAMMHLFTPVSNEDENKSAYVRFVRKRKKRRVLRFAVSSMKYVATVLIVVISTYWTVERYMVPHDRTAATNTLYVPVGQRARITLQDGTTVWLNAQSTLTYPSHFGGKERRVSLIGEGYFDVVHNEKKPFIVSASQVEMMVLGTKFNVYSYPEAGYTQTSLIEGAVRVSLSESPDTGIVLNPNEQVLVQEGQMTLETIKYPEIFLWKEGIYSFNDERLENIVKKLELYYDVKIIIKTPELADLKYTCKFRQRDGIDEILRIIRRIHKFNFEKDKEKNTITLS
ncbi:MAG: FecR domain-containing protein [Dysgonamonadaceae bacterium]|jgi:ferric-dicitrate binding protein FerR (iron transport regulator)|nr:FecR domain-containing protein [Dysgonamonadaceae bacterium]